MKDEETSKKVYQKTSIAENMNEVSRKKSFYEDKTEAAPVKVFCKSRCIIELFTKDEYQLILAFCNQKCHF
jgi:hypothetical protein